jgi:16S rRNA (guanine527-N7)-methyltransferase
VVPEAAAAVFGDRLPLAEEYVRLLGTSGTERGLVGPREADRLWERHVLNCAVLSELVPDGAAVVDVGSGAGLPGLPLALARPDVSVELVEPLLRRTTWLDEVVAALGLTDQVTVTRGKTTVIGRRSADAVTARAVAPLDRLLPMCRRLVRPQGVLLALKGASAQQELDAVPRSARAGWDTDMTVARCGGGVLAEETTVVVARRAGGA